MSLSLQLPCLFFFLIIISLTSATKDIHDLLPDYGFPKGLIPNAVVSYTISSNGDFSIILSHPCYVEFDQLVYYDKLVKGKLSYGSVTDVSGIQAKKFFLWVNVNGMSLDSSSNMIEFHVGGLSQKLPADQFVEIPDCKNKACQHNDTILHQTIWTGMCWITG